MVGSHRGGDGGPRMRFRRDDPSNPIAMVVSVSVDGQAIEPERVSEVDTEAGVVEARVWPPAQGEDGAWLTQILLGAVEVRWSHRVELGGGLVGEIGEPVNDEDFAAFVARNGG